MLCCFLAAGVIPTECFSSEETVVLSFSRQQEEAAGPGIYRVQRGDSLYRILERECSLKDDEIPRMLEKVKQINPSIKNIDVIFPGQEILLPAASETGDSDDATGTPSVNGESKEQVMDDGESAERSTILYTVRPGDSLGEILHRLFDIQSGEMNRCLEAVAAANPGITDINRIYPGQKLTFPDFSASSADTAGQVLSEQNENTLFTLTASESLPFLEEIFIALGADIVTEGNWYIPLASSGRITIDCARVPVASFPDGHRILMDCAGLIPSSVVGTLREQWNNYHVIACGDAADPLAIIDGMADMQHVPLVVEKTGRMAGIPGNPDVQIFFDRTVRASSGKTAGIRLLDDADEPLPDGLSAAIGARGTTVIEISESSLYSPSFDSVATPAYPARLEGRTPVDMAMEILRFAGLEVRRNADVPVFVSSEDGFNLSVSADLYLERADGALLLTSRSLPPQFLAILTERGFRVLELSKMTPGEAMIEQVARAAGLPVEKKYFKFSLFPENPDRLDHVRFSAVRVDGKDGSLYFVEDSFDAVFYRFLVNRWKVFVVVY